jgi:hypothetical protein
MIRVRIYFILGFNRCRAMSSEIKEMRQGASLYSCLGSSDGSAVILLVADWHLDRANYLLGNTNQYYTRFYLSTRFRFSRMPTTFVIQPRSLLRWDTKFSHVFLVFYIRLINSYDVHRIEKIFASHATVVFSPLTVIKSYIPQFPSPFFVLGFCRLGVILFPNIILKYNFPWKNLL